MRLGDAGLKPFPSSCLSGGWGGCVLRSVGVLACGRSRGADDRFKALPPFAVIVGAAVRFVASVGLTGVLGADVVGTALAYGGLLTSLGAEFDNRRVARYDALVRKTLSSHASLVPADLVCLRTRDEILWAELRDQELRTPVEAVKAKVPAATTPAAPAAPVAPPPPPWVPPKPSGPQPLFAAGDKRGAAAANVGGKNGVGGKGPYNRYAKRY